MIFTIIFTWILYLFFQDSLERVISFTLSKFRCSSLQLQKVIKYQLTTNHIVQ